MKEPRWLTPYESQVLHKVHRYLTVYRVEESLTVLAGVIHDLTAPLPCPGDLVADEYHVMCSLESGHPLSHEGCVVNGAAQLFWTDELAQLTQADSSAMWA